jgi:hypothetical protein
MSILKHGPINLRVLQRFDLLLSLFSCFQGSPPARGLFPMFSTGDSVYVASGCPDAAFDQLSGWTCPTTTYSDIWLLNNTQSLSWQSVPNSTITPDGVVAVSPTSTPGRFLFYNDYQSTGQSTTSVYFDSATNVWSNVQLSSNITIPYNQNGASLVYYAGSSYLFGGPCPIMFFHSYLQAV